MAQTNRGYLKATRPAKLCRSLCRNPGIPARLTPYRGVSLRDKQRAVNMLPIRINTTPSYHSDFLRVA